MTDCAAHIALAGATVLAWIGAGSLVLAPIRSSGDRGLDALNRLGAGAVAFALLTFAAGWLGFLRAGAYVALLVVMGVVGVFAVARLGLARPRDWARWEVALGVLIGAYVVTTVLVTCAPISSADALYYHATIPELFEREGRIVEVPWMWQSYQPFTVELLVLDGFLLWDSVQGAFAPLLLGLAGAATVFVGARRIVPRGVALLATAIYLCQPFAVWLLTSTFVEPAAAFTVALAAANLARFARGAGAEALVLAGIFAGATAGMKYIAGVAAGVLAIAALVYVRRRWSTRYALAFGLPAVAVALPWFVKNAIVTGDPAYPLLLGWATEETRHQDLESLQAFGHGRGVADLVLLPYRLLADADAFNRAEFITPLFLLFAPASLLDPRARRVAATALSLVGAYVLVWFFSVQDARYLLPAMPVLAVLAAVGIVAVARRSRVGRTVAVASTLVAFAAGGAISLVYDARFASYVLGRESEREFLRETVSYHASVEWLNEHLPAGSRVVVDNAFLLHIDADALAWTSDALPAAAGAAEARRFVRDYGVTHAIVFAHNVPRKRQLAYVDARRIGRVLAKPVFSRTRRSAGAPVPMDVYAIAR